MELKKHINFRNVFLIVYIMAFAIYVIVGLSPAKAHDYKVSGSFAIPSINLVSDVTTLEITNRKLDTPDTIVGSYSRAQNKTLLIGHSTTVFQNLDRVGMGDELIYNGVSYYVNDIVIRKKEDISMIDLLKKEDNETLVVMTCAGELLGGGEATHRLIVTASVR